MSDTAANKLSAENLGQTFAAQVRVQHPLEDAVTYNTVQTKRHGCFSDHAHVASLRQTFAPSLVTSYRFPSGEMESKDMDTLQKNRSTRIRNVPVYAEEKKPQERSVARHVRTANHVQLMHPSFSKSNCQCQDKKSQPQFLKPLSIDSRCQAKNIMN